MLDKKALQSLPKVPKGGKMRFLPDGAVSGLGVIWGARGKPSWTFAYRDDAGDQHRTKLGFVYTGPAGKEPTPEWLSIDAARLRAYRMRVEGVIIPRRGGRATTRGAMSFGEAIEAYLDDPNVKALRSLSEIERMLRKDAAPLFGRSLATITKQ